MSDDMCGDQEFLTEKELLQTLQLPSTRFDLRPPGSRGNAVSSPDTAGDGLDDTRKLPDETARAISNFASAYYEGLREEFGNRTVKGVG